MASKNTLNFYLEGGVDLRDPNRLYGFYSKLQDIHIQYFPDWRFGQFCCNFFGWIATVKKIDVFFPEEDKMIKYLEEYVKEHQ